MVANTIPPTFEFGTPSQSKEKLAELVSTLPSSRACRTPQPPQRPPQMSEKSRCLSVVPTQLGSWSLGKTIGCGSTAKIKVARHVETKELVAIKIIPRQQTEQSETCRSVNCNRDVRATREATLCSLMNHPHISCLREVVHTNTHWFLLLEYCNGGQLLDYIIRHGRLKETKVRKFGRQIVSALDYCHRNNIAHLNLSLQNILVSKTGDIKLIDFCCSTLYTPIFTALNAQCCSHYFPAPEMIQGRRYAGPEVDVWCLGIVLYILVCGKVPFDAQDTSALREKILECHVGYPWWLSLKCKNLISRMLVLDPQQRASMSEIQHHPWMVKSFDEPPASFLPYREPLQLPLDPKLVNKMTEFGFGRPDQIMQELEIILKSEDYRQWALDFRHRLAAERNKPERKCKVFKFFKRKIHVPHTRLTKLCEVYDPPYHPMISIYYLVREKLERERRETQNFSPVQRGNSH